jgi:hypothetical protein
MTKKEFYGLKPGDKIVYTDERYMCPKTSNLQKENGGFLVVEGFARGMGNGLMIGLGSFHTFGVYQNMEFYEEPNLPWSYERDY